MMEVQDTWLVQGQARLKAQHLLLVAPVTYLSQHWFFGADS